MKKSKRSKEGIKKSGPKIIFAKTIPLPENTKRIKVKRSRAPLLHVDRPAEKPLAWTRQVVRLNKEGDHLIIIRDGYRQIGASLIEAKYVKEELKGEKIGEVQSLGKITRTAKSAPEKEIVEPAGDKSTMTAKQLRKEVISGNFVFNKKGKKIPMTKKAELTPDKKFNVVVELKNKIKHYHLT